MMHSSKFQRFLFSFESNLPLGKIYALTYATSYETTSFLYKKLCRVRYSQEVGFDLFFLIVRHERTSYKFIKKCDGQTDGLTDKPILYQKCRKIHSFLIRNLF